MLWAKIDVDICGHRLFLGKPDFYVRLVVGLIGAAKKQYPDGVLRNLTAATAKELCHIQAPLKQVQTAIDFLVTEGWLIPHPDLAFEIKDYRQRQGDGASTKRVRDWREKQRYIGVTVTPPATFLKRAVERAELEEEKRDVALAQGHEEATGKAEPVDNLDLEGLSESDKAQATKLLSEGQGVAATAFLASLRRRVAR